MILSVYEYILHRDMTFSGNVHFKDTFLLIFVLTKSAALECLLFGKNRAVDDDSF